MSFSFEVRESDLLGRLGTMSAGGKRLETPCLFPVVHPVVQSLSINDIRDVGFDALMTNAYILYRRRREEALANGLHRLLGFDGVLMTDSGGYQVLEYGDLDVTYGEIARFESEVGSDLAVTLDRPTGYEASKKRARETEEYSTGNALATMREFGASKTTWVGPVQGGLFADILTRSAKSLVKGGFRLLALGSPVQVMENYMYPELVAMIAAARKSIPYSVPLHLFGAGHPHTLAISVALGCDTFDSASYILFARAGRYMTERGSTALKEMSRLPCSCPVCRGRSVKDLLDAGAAGTTLLALHNLHVLKKEVELCKEAMAEGRLWDLVEERAMAHPRLHAALSAFPKLSKMLEPGTQPLKGRGLFVRNRFDESRPELRTARAYLDGAMRRSSETALILGGAGPTPPRRLRKKGTLAKAGDPDVYRIHEQLGVYPVELDFVYPFTQTVSGSPAEEGLLGEGTARLRAMGYKRILFAPGEGSLRVKALKARSRRKRAAASPSPRTASSLPRAPRRP